MQYTIYHDTTYSYPSRAHGSYTVCRLQPRSDLTQYCTNYELMIEPIARIFSYQDRFGNDVQHFGYLPGHDRLRVRSRSSVATVGPHDPTQPYGVTPDMLAADPRLPELYDFLHESTYATYGPALREFAALLGTPDDDLAAYFLRAGRAVNEAFRYDQDATTVHTTVDESVRLRSGVCQDFAHVLVALCRLHNIPARYVSGYIFSGQENSVLGAEASHAWCEAYLPPHGWVGYDPTNARLINDEFVKIAVGRDYRDVSPVHGVYKGDSESLMSVNVAVEAMTSQQ